MEDLFDDNGWVTGDAKGPGGCRTQLQWGQKQFGIPIYNTPQIKQPIPRTEKSLDIKLARKVSKRSKRDLRGLWKTLAPGSTVVRTSPTTTVIKEPGVPEVRVRNIDIAKLGTRAERNMDLWQYAQRRPFHMRIQQKRR